MAWEDFSKHSVFVTVLKMNDAYKFNSVHADHEEGGFVLQKLITDQDGPCNFRVGQISERTLPEDSGYE